MWWTSTPPWMHGMGMDSGAGMGQPMIPGAGMPPYGRAPMNMTPVQMAPPSAVPGAPSPGGPAQPLNPAQMGLLSAMLSQKTQVPKPEAAPGQGAPVGPATGAAGALPNA